MSVRIVHFVSKHDFNFSAFQCDQRHSFFPFSLLKPSLDMPSRLFRNRLVSMQRRLHLMTIYSYKHVLSHVLTGSY